MPHAVLHSICKCNNILEKILTQSVRRRKASCLGNQPGTSQTCRPQPCPEDPHHCSQCRQRSIPCCESVRHIPELWTRDLGERLKMNTILSKRCYLMLVTIAQSDVLCQVSSELNISLTSQDHVATSSLNVEFCGCSNSHYRQRCTAAGRRWYWLRQTMPWRQRWSLRLHTYATLRRGPSRCGGKGRRMRSGSTQVYRCTTVSTLT